jgi:alpha-glucoside transport system substrate-binding protein
MNSWFTPTYLLGQYDQAWLDMLTYNNEMIGIWTNTNIKSIVWYPKAKFEAAGYQVPTTWTEMISLTQQIADDGKTPWCIGIGSGAATGWVGTDWVEDIMLRTTSTSSYDDWTLGNLLFSSAQVKNAFQTMGQIWLNDTYVYSGTAEIKNISFGAAPQPMFEDPPGCYLHRQATFITQFFPPEAELGVDVDYFVLPPIDPQYDTPLLVAGDMYAVMADRPEVRQYARFLTTAESVKYVIEQGGVLSPHKDVDLSWYPSDFERGYAQLLANASVVRYDGSDSMPSQVGTSSFWSGVVDFVDGVDLDTILANIDSSWP